MRKCKDCGERFNRQCSPKDYESILETGRCLSCREEANSRNDEFRQAYRNMNIQEEAEELVENEFCGACDGSESGCNMQNICDGYKEEVKNIITEMEE